MRLPCEGRLHTAGSVHVRLADSTQLDEAAIWRIERVISQEEHLRAGRFRSRALGIRFMAGRAMLRTLLAERLQVPARDISFRRTASGKPVLDGPFDQMHGFSLSYAGPLILIAISPGARVGVDIEPLRPIPDAESIVARHFAAPEKVRWAGLAEHLRQRAFLEAWTRKEAVLKATGGGIAKGLQNVDVTFEPDVSPRIIAVDGNANHNWQLQTLSEISGHVAAVVTEGAARTDTVETQKWS